jgi:hypothetical protein
VLPNVLIVGAASLVVDGTDLRDGRAETLERPRTHAGQAFAGGSL